MKRISFILLFVAPLIIGTTFSGCKKYDDGPMFSLRSKKERISNSWRIDKVFETPSGGGKTEKTQDYKNAYYNYLMVIDIGGSYTVSYRPFNLGDYNENGTWIFGADKTNLVLNTSNGNSSIGNVWAIYRLKEDELWMRTYNNNNTVVEAHFIPN